ncbi:MAG TPA: hypothetical protein VK447_17515 [Myxococcaceae bacterium]|nr:hypothetical protein [Myxococcaceae bacterium]
MASWPGVLFLFFASAAQALVFPGLLVLFQLRNGGALVAGLFALGVAWVIGALLRVLSLGGIIAEASLRLRGQPSPGFVAAALGASPHALGYLLVGFLVDLLVSWFRWVAFIATGSAYVVSLVKGGGGFLPSVGLALAITICLPLGLFATLWTQTALSRAVALERGYLASLYELAGVLAARPWRALGVLVVTGLFGWGAELFLTLFTQLGAATSSERAWIVDVWARVAAGVLAALVWALMDATRFNAFAALELADADLLPRPPVPAPAPVPYAAPPAAGLAPALALAPVGAVSVETPAESIPPTEPSPTVEEAQAPVVSAEPEPEPSVQAPSAGEPGPDAPADPAVSDSKDGPTR